MKTPLGHVEEDGRRPVDRDPWQQQVDANQEPGDYAPRIGEPPLDVGWVNITARTVIPDGCDGVDLRRITAGGLGSGFGSGSFVGTHAWNERV